jgi:hypothetical protein
MASLSEIAATTYEYREKKTADLVADNIPFLYMIRDSGNFKVITGGREIWEDFLGWQNQYYQAIDANEEIALGYNQTIGGFQFQPKIAVIPVLINALEKAQNQGDAAFRDLVKTRLMVADSTFENNLESDLQGDGTGRGGKAFAGIKAYITKTPTVGSIGGVPRATVTSIQNVAVNGPTLFGGATTSANIETRLRYTRNLLLRGKDSPSVGFVGQTYYNAAADALSAKQRYTRDEKMANAGFDNISIENMTLILAQGKSFSGLTKINPDEGYILNPSTFNFKAYRGYNMQPLPERTSVNQLIEISLQVLIGNLTINNPALNGVLFDS